MFLLKWEIVKIATDSELAVDTFLGDVEILDVEEAPLANCSDEGTGKHLPALQGGVEGEVYGDQVGPVEVGLQPREFRIWSCENERRLLTFVSWTYW